MVFIKDFIKSLHYSVFDPDQLKVDILTCGQSLQVKMLFMSHFTSPFIEPLCPLRYTTVELLASIPYFHFHQVVEGDGGRDSKEGKEGWGLGVHTPVESNRPKHFQACIMGSCGTIVIKTWMRRRGRGLQSISYGSLGLSSLIDWSPGAAAPFCKVHYIITLQRNNTFNKHKIIHIQPQATPGLWRFPERAQRRKKMQ